MYLDMTNIVTYNDEVCGLADYPKNSVNLEMKNSIANLTP